ncbi:DNA glycosylase AlkZ-like family protein [Nocardioides sp.]|uniref:DNA glycosylase AlkZ-like family protein n=1 Tax=Nocardioides sp. TaxID=35761 RepID=UPI00352963C6
MSITWAQALTWRLRRQLLSPPGDEPVAAVVRRLGAVLAMDQGLAELVVGLRRSTPQPGEVARALVDGELVKVFAFRGATHYLAPDDAGAYLALRGAGRQWELPSWQDYYQLTAQDWPAFRETVREALTEGPLTLDELGAAVTGRAAYRHLRPVFDDGAGTLIKPLTWQGDMGFGPPRDGRATFQRLDADPRWAGVWELDEAGPYAITSYVGGYGPTTTEQVHYWLGSGLSAGTKRLRGWLADLGDRLATVDIEGEPRLMLREHVDDLLATEPAGSVHLLPGHDPWVIGPSTKDERVVPADRRTPVTRKANLVLVDGVVAGTWKLGKARLEVTWLAGGSAAPAEELAAATERVAGVVGRPLELRVG